MSLAVLAIGCISPLAIVAVLSTLYFYDSEQSQLTVTAISRARAMSAVVDREIASTQSALLALGTSPLLANGDLRGFRAQAAAVLRNINAENIVVVDTAGQMLLVTDRPFGEALPKLSNPPLLRHILDTGKPGVSDLFLSKVTGRLIFSVAVPVQRGGSIQWSLNASILPAQLLSVLTEQKFPDSWRASIADSTGSVVARTHDMEKFLGRLVNPDLLQRMRAANEDGFETRTLDGIPVITVYSRSPVTKWTVILGMPLDELAAGVRRSLAWLIAAILAALFLGLSLARFIGGRIAGSITALAKPALALGSGEIPRLPPMHFREAIDLGNALLDAATTLHQAQYDVNHDALTGLPNRALFQMFVSHQLALCLRNKTSLSILYIDLDGFKLVNDSYGHAVGDQLLHAVSSRIEDAIRESDIAARLGGDEFAIALIDASLENATAFAGRLVGTVSDPYQLGEIRVSVSASIGVAAYPASAKDVDTLLRSADFAMYKAKSLGKRQVCAATP